MTNFLQLTFNGAVMGGIYALIAVGFILIFNAVGVVNFAQGELLMIGAFVGCTIVKKYNTNIITTIGVVIVVMAIVGLLFTKIVYESLKNMSAMSMIIGTVGIGTGLQNLALIIFGTLPVTVDPFFGHNTIDLMGIKILPHSVLVLLITFLFIAGQHFLFNKTSMGNKLRAVAQDKETSLLMGINADRMILITFMVSSILAGVAGILIAPTLFVTPTLGGMLLLKAFAAVVIGGFGSVSGAIVGGLIIGLLEVFIAAYVSSSYETALVYLILILILLIRPQGIFGEKISQKA